MPFGILRDGDFQVSDSYKVIYFPTTFVISPAGIITGFHAGEITLDDLEQYIAEVS